MTLTVDLQTNDSVTLTVITGAIVVAPTMDAACGGNATVEFSTIQVNGAVFGSFGSFHYVGLRIDGLGSRLDARIDAQGTELGQRIDRLGARIDSLETRLDARIEALTARMDEISDATRGSLGGVSRT